MFRGTDSEALRRAVESLARLEHETELIKTVLLVKDPGSPIAVDAFDGLRRQVIAGASERRSHLAQVVAMAVAVNRATSVEDLRPQVREWMSQSEIVELVDCASDQTHLVFEDVDGGSLEGAVDLEVLEPAYLDGRTGAVLRTGRARRAQSVDTDQLPALDDLPSAKEPIEVEPADVETADVEPATVASQSDLEGLEK